MQTAGFAASLIGGFLPGLSAGWLGLTPDDPTTFRYSLHLVALAVVPTLLLIAATREIGPVRPATRRGPGNKAPLMIITVMTVLRVLRKFGEGSARTFFNVYMDAGLDVETVKIGITFAIAQLVAGPMALLSPILSKRIVPGPATLVEMIGVAICLVPMALIAKPIAANVGLIAVLSFIPIMRPAIAVYTMDLVRLEY